MDEKNTPIVLKPNIDPESKENIDQIMQRLKNIQPELRDYILGPSYANDFLNIIKTYSLASEYVTELESITTMTLLGFIPPNEVKQEINQSLPNISSSVKDGIYENILKTILTKERVAVLERNWQEDDAIEKELTEYIELEEVPKPVSQNKPEPIKPTYEIRPNPIITEERLSKTIKDDSTAWENKLQNQKSTISSRTETDTSIPQVESSSKKIDMYREIPE